MTTTTDIKFEFYIEGTSDQDTSTSLSPADATDLGLNAGVVVDQLGGGITFNNAGSIKGGKTDWDVGIGFWLGYQPDAYKVAIGDPAEEKITWDGSDLVLDIDASHLTINGGTAGQLLSVDSNGVATFVSLALGDLTDVSNATPATNQVLGWSGTEWQPQNASSTFSLALEDLTNVSNAAPSTNQVLGWSGTEWQPQNASSTFSLAFEDLSNAIGSTPQINDIWMKTGASGYEPTQFVLQNMANVNFSSGPANDDLLQYNSTTQKWENVAPSSLSSSLQQTIAEHTDVTFSSLSSGEVLWYDASSTLWRDGYYKLSLQSITGSNNKGLQLVDPGGNSSIFQKIEFEPGDGIGLGHTGSTLEISSSVLAFKTIAVAGQSDIVADTFDDTLTFVAGSNIVLTTTPNNDSLTITSTGGVGALNDLTNVSTTPSNGDVLYYQSSNTAWNSGQYRLTASDAPTGNNKQILLVNPAGSYSGSTGQINLEPGAGINIGRNGQTLSISSTAATEAFKTIAVSGQSNVVADSAADTLTLVAGTGITLTTSPTNDSVTITSTGTSGGATEAFKTIAIAGQSDVVADSAADTLTLIAGTGVALTTSPNNDSVTISAGEGAAEAFKTIAVSGQSNVVADSAADTLNLVAGSNMTITTIATGDSITFAASGGSGGGDAFRTIAVSGQSDVVADSAADTLTLVAGSNMTITTNATGDSITFTALNTQNDDSLITDADGDTKITVEASPDEDKIRLRTSGYQRMLIDEEGNVIISDTSENYAGARLTVNAFPSQVWGYPMFQLGQESFSAGGLYSIGMGYTSSTYDKPPVQIGAKTLSSSGGTTADIVFGTRSVTTNTAATERIRILNTGGITFDGETTSPHALDDYQEGTWTPRFADAISGGNYVTAGTQALGTYTKIGDIVHLSCPAQNINPSGLTTSNVLYVTNFPFTVSSSHLQVPCTSINFSSYAVSNMSGAYFMAQPGQTYGRVILPEAAGNGMGLDSELTVGDILRTSAPYTAVRWSLTYKAA